MSPYALRYWCKDDRSLLHACGPKDATVVEVYVHDTTAVAFEVPNDSLALKQHLHQLDMAFQLGRKAMGDDIKNLIGIPS